MENIRYEVWLQNQDKFVTQCTIVLIRKNIGSIKFISGGYPIFFRIRTIVHCVTNIVTLRILTIPYEDCKENIRDTDR